MSSHILSAAALLVMIIFAVGSVDTARDGEPRAAPQTPPSGDGESAEAADETGRAPERSPRVPIEEQGGAAEPSDGPPTVRRAVAPIRITQVAGKSPREVMAILGEPTSVTPLTSFPEDMPGELREYRHADFTVVVQFFEGRAITATIDLQSLPADSPTEALSHVGLSPTELTETFQTPRHAPTKIRVIHWRGIVDGVEIDDVSATNTGVSRPAKPIDEWVLVAVHFPRWVRSKTAQDVRQRGTMRNWTDNTGKHHVKAELVEKGERQDYDRAAGKAERRGSQICGR
ncbi:MAG: hypothetical protein ACREHD_22470, partial [Pirellulales bacterium]